jgi:uncharacterized membrane protein
MTAVEGTTVEDPKIRRSRLVGAGLLAGMGVLHFAVPKAFDGAIPGWVPGRPRTWTYASGVWELASAALVANRRTSRVGGYAAAATFAVVYPANIQMAIDNPPTNPLGIGMLLRLPLQIPMVVWALRHARRA